MKFLRNTFIMSIVFVLSPFIAVADKSDDTLVIAFTREITNLDYNYGTKTEYIILSDMIDDSLFYVEPKNLSYVPALTDFTKRANWSYVNSVYPSSSPPTITLSDSVEMSIAGQLLQLAQKVIWVLWAVIYTFFNPSNSIC